MAISFNIGNSFSSDSHKVNGLSSGEITFCTFNTSTTPIRKSADIHVDLSSLGRALSSGTGNSKSTKEAKLEKIDESGFSKEMKEVMKRIVELKDQLEKKQQELQKAMKDQSLGAEQRQQKASAIQSEISNISSALKSAMGMLSENMQKEVLDTDAAVEVAGLIL